jgi:hypothetical protein
VFGDKIQGTAGNTTLFDGSALPQKSGCWPSLPLFLITVCALPLERHISAGFSCHVSLSQGSEEGKWPRPDQLGFLSWETASVSTRMKTIWKPLALVVSKGTAKRRHCPSRSMGMQQFLGIC